MLIKTHSDGFLHPASSEITPQRVYAGRRDMVKLMASGVAGAALATWAGREAMAQGSGKLAPLVGAKSAVAGAAVPVAEANPALDDWRATQSEG